jgi:hypothetical protein
MAYNSNTALTVSTTYSNIVSSSEPVPAGFHRMPDGSLMYGDEHTKGFNYTDGDVFLNSDNSNYIGYYNYTGNSVWSGRRKNSDSNEIFARDNMLGIYNSERVLFSRGSEEIIKLKNQKEKILFDPGEFINEKSINLKLKMLYENYLDLYNFSHIQPSNIPNSFTGIIGITGTDAGNDQTDTYLHNLGYTTNTSTDILSSGHTSLGGVIGFEMLGMSRETENPLDFTTPTRNLTIFFSPSSLQFYNFRNDNVNGSSLSFITSADVADVENSHPFQGITDITTNNRDTLYVCDAYHNQIYRIYIDPVTNESRINSGNFDLLNAANYRLNTAGKEVLSGATHLYYFNSELYTYNEGIDKVIVLNDNLTFQRSFSNKLFSESDVVDMEVNPTNGTLYCLLKNMSIVEIDHKFKGNYTVNLNKNFLDPGEVPRRLILSQNASNIYYIVTNTNIYKFIMTDDRLQNNYIGRFVWSSTPSLSYGGVEFGEGNNQLYDAKILIENNDYDSIFALDIYRTEAEDPDGDVLQILRFNESNNNAKCLNDSLYKVYSSEDVYIRDSYFNNITFNKSIKKLLFNTDNLASNIVARFGYSYNTDKHLVFANNIMLSSNLFVEKDYNYFVGVNEPLTPQTFNRCLLAIYNYHEYILESLQSVKLNLKYPLNEVVSF